MWEYIIWPFVLELNKSYFTLEEYRKMIESFNRKEYSNFKNVWGMVSLLVKGILTQDKKYYSIHYKLIPYTKKCPLRLRNCSKGSKVKKINDLYQK
jgi:hypothetical protein